MTYKLQVFHYDSGLNELLDAQDKRWNARAKCYIVHNKVKAKNDDICERAIRASQALRNVHINNPVIINYTFFIKDKKRDRSNIAAAFIKSFEDALQHCKVIKNDTYDLVLDSTKPHKFYIDKENPRVEVEIIEVEKLI